MWFPSNLRRHSCGKVGGSGGIVELIVCWHKLVGSWWPLPYCGMFRMADRVPVAVPVRPGCHQSPWKCLVVRRRIQRRLSRVRPVVNQTMYCLCLLPYIYLWFADFGTGGCICIALNRDRHHQICRSLSVLCSRYVGKGVTLYLGV